MLKRAKVVETAYGELTRALKAAPDPAVLVRVNMAATAKLTTAEKEIQRLNEEMKVRFARPQTPTPNPPSNSKAAQTPASVVQDSVRRAS